MGIEHAAFHRRLQKKMRSTDTRLKELYGRTCQVDGRPANAEGQCPVCRRQIVEIERDPIPAGTQVPVDPEKAARLKEFYARYGREQAEREKTASETEPTREVQRLPGETWPGDPLKRDWARVVGELGLKRRW